MSCPKTETVSPRVTTPISSLVQLPPPPLPFVSLPPPPPPPIIFPPPSTNSPTTCSTPICDTLPRPQCASSVPPPTYIFLNTALPPPGYANMGAYAQYSQSPQPLFPPKPVTKHTPAPVSGHVPKLEPPSPNNMHRKKGNGDVHIGRNVFTQAKLKHPFLRSKGLSPKKKKKGAARRSDDYADMDYSWERDRERAPVPRRDDRSRSRGRSRSKSRDRRYSNCRRRESPNSIYGNSRRTNDVENSRDTNRGQSPKYAWDRKKTPPRQYSQQTSEVSSSLSSARVPLSAVDLSDVGSSDHSDVDDTNENLKPMMKSDYWPQAAPSKGFYIPSGDCHIGSGKCVEMGDKFKRNVLQRIDSAKNAQMPIEPQKTSLFDVTHSKCKCCGDASSCDSDSDGSSDESTDGEDVANQRFQKAMQQLNSKQNHSATLHSELWFNQKDMMNDGPLCRCSWASKQHGIRHSIFPGEEKIALCTGNSNNLDKLFHYVLNISPVKVLCQDVTTIICYNEREYKLTGFSIFTHKPLPEKMPVCLVTRGNVEYTLRLVKEEPPECFTVSELELFWKYFYVDLCEMLDLNRWPSGIQDGCPNIHAMPRFTRRLTGNGIEILGMCHVLEYLIHESKLIVNEETVAPSKMWDKLVEKTKAMIVYNPQKRPCAIRADGIDWRGAQSEFNNCPVIVHFGMRPSVITYAGNPTYQKAWKQFVKLRHLMLMKGTLNSEDKHNLYVKQQNLESIKAKSRLKRDVTVEIACDGFHATGLYADSVMHAMMVLVMMNHLRFHLALDVFEATKIKYKFKNRALLELAFSHPSYRTNYGVNADHARNTMSNCGVRQPANCNARRSQVNVRKRGINTLLDIMSKMGSKKITESQVRNNERLEYLGDAVIEFLSTIHLFYMFPNLEEGGLATYRSALVQNKHLAVLAKKMGLDSYMLYAHGPDLCHSADLKHAMANAFEAVMGALFLDAGLPQVDRVFGEVLFDASIDPEEHHVWTHLPKHPLQVQEPDGDRHWIKEAQALHKLTLFEKQTGIEFVHIRLLARAFTRRNVGYNFLTLGHNQRLEFLGDTVLQLITSEYLYKHFPEHHEGHLSLLRSCLVNNKTQSVICEDLGMVNYVISPPITKGQNDLRMKDKADLVESFIGALYVDRGLEFCKTFCKVCFYPRLKYFIMSQRWNDPKSQLQQSCLTLRNVDGGDPHIPQYKVIAVEGPTNTRVYKVAVYFRGNRLADACGHSVQEAEMKSAELALNKFQHMFPNLSGKRAKKARVRDKRGQFGPPQKSPTKNAGYKIKDKYMHMKQKTTHASQYKKNINNHDPV